MAIYPQPGTKWRCKCKRPKCETIATVLGWTQFVGKEMMALESCMVVFTVTPAPSMREGEVMIYHLSEFFEDFEKVS